MNPREYIRHCIRACGFEVLKYAPGKRRLYHGERILLLQQGQISLDEARFLGELVRTVSGSGPIIEIGTLFGWSTRILALFKPDARPIIAVDNFCWNPLGISPEEHLQATQAALADAVARHNVHLVNMGKDEFYASYRGSAPALVFLDAGHSYEDTKHDIEWAKRVGAQIICGHDYDRNDWPGVVRAVEEYGGAQRLVGTLWLLDQHASL
jgi:hypothetical protein